MIFRIIKLIFALPLIFVMVWIVMINVKLDYHPQVLIDRQDTINFELVKQLRGLKSALRHNADVEMQDIYPEGYVFLNAVYALAWSSFLQKEQSKTFTVEGYAEIHQAWLKINSPTGREPFSDGLSLPYGSFYNGWSAYVLASKLSLENTALRKNDEVHLFRQQCERIAEVIQQQTYPESYHDSGWPADVMMCVASLSLHDRLFEPKYKDIIDRWLIDVKHRLDANGMIPHSALVPNGSPGENARGSSMALMLIFLRDIDLQFAGEQFQLFKKNFVDTTCGLTGIREYPKGESGTGDIDSGPVVFGFGGVATIVGIQTLSLYGEEQLSCTVRNAVEAVSLSYQTEEEKSYFFGLLPIADVFITWGDSSAGVAQQDVSFKWFRVCSLLIFASLATLFWMMIRKTENSKIFNEKIISR